jgi:hypothetical protein
MLLWQQGVDEVEKFTTRKVHRISWSGVYTCASPS